MSPSAASRSEAPHDGHVTASTGTVAEDAGYQSEAAFQRAFKLHMGLSPAQYRKQARASADIAG